MAGSGFWACAVQRRGKGVREKAAILKRGASRGCGARWARCFGRCRPHERPEAKADRGVWRLTFDSDEVE